MANEYNNAKLGRIHVFEDTMRMISESHPKIWSSFQKSLQKSCVILDAAPPCPREGVKTQILVTRNKTMDAGRRWSKQYNTAVLNFASATTPGGGVTRGAGSQEECLCRVSTLYPLLSQPAFYESFYKPNRDANDPLHSDALIYTPKVCVFKRDDYVLLDEKDYAYVDVITCAAPNLRERPSNVYNPGDGVEAADCSPDRLYEIHVSRARHILGAAVTHGVRAIVLGAFGCGAFKNDPEVVARAWKLAVSEYASSFDVIEFAIYCGGGDTTNYEAFAKEFS